MTKLPTISKLLKEKTGLDLEAKEGRITIYSDSWSTTIFEEDLDWLESVIEETDERYLLSLLFYRDCDCEDDDLWDEFE